MTETVRKFRILARFLVTQPDWSINRICECSFINRPAVEAVLKGDEPSLHSTTLKLMQDFVTANDEHPWKNRASKPKQQKYIKKPLPHPEDEIFLKPLKDALHNKFYNAMDEFLKSVPVDLDVSIKIRPKTILENKNQC